MTDHHRKPESLGGGNDKRNISSVPRYQHQAWHTLFDSLSPLQILERLEYYWFVFGAQKTRAQSRMVRDWILAIKSRSKKKEAWETLFRGASLDEVIVRINRVWIDPDCELILSFRKTPRIAITIVK
jgi:hypothetical protein